MHFGALSCAVLIACTASHPSTKHAGAPPDPIPSATGGDTESEEPSDDEEPSTVEAPCTKEECGPAMGMPNTQCADGKTVGGPVCKRDAQGKCGYAVIECPS